MFFRLGKAITESELVQQCKKGKRAAQEEVYARYSRKIYAICLRYLKNDFDAEEVLVTSFTKVFEKIDQFQGNGSFEGWIKRLAVNEALMYLRKHKQFQVNIEDDIILFETKSVQGDHLEAEDLLKLIEQLPTGYNTVFNLYAIEGYSHKEIADMLGISENTSKSQLSRARTLLQKLLAEAETITKPEEDFFPSGQIKKIELL
jgi:RNA polymerase sigma factor (sigma-70 family)